MSDATLGAVVPGVESLPGVESHAGHADEHQATNTGMSNTKLAIWTFLGSECLLFGALISTYFIYRHRGAGQIHPHDIYDVPFTSVSSFVLLMSSLTMVLAVSALQRGALARSRSWVLATALLGSVFIAGQVYEFTSFVHVGMTLSSSLSGGAFYVMTGFHGVHVTIGILMLLSLFARSLQGRLTQRNAETLEVVGLYWHFVDVVWIVIFTVVYLIP